MPVTLSGMSTRAIDLPTSLKAFGSLVWTLSFDLQGEGLAADQLRVGDLLAAARHDAVGDGEIVALDVEFLRGLVEQGIARGRRRVADLDAGGLHGEAAPGIALIGGEHGVAGDERDRLERHVELFGGHLRERGADAGAEIDLAGIHRDHPGLVDGEEGIDLGERHRLCSGAAPCASASPGLAGEREADDKRAGALQKFAA